MKDSLTNKRVIIIGAGVAGLSAAYYLRKRGVDVDIIERAKGVGGNLRSALKEDRYLIEYGPHFFSAESESLIKLSRELSIDSQMIDCKVDPRKCYIYKKGSLYRVPRGSASLIMSGLISIPGKFRLLTEPFRKQKVFEQESFAEFAIRRLGRAALTSYIDPLVSWRSAGEPYQLEVKSSFSFLSDLERRNGKILPKVSSLMQRIFCRKALSFRWGMGTLTARLEEELRKDLMPGVTVNEISLLPPKRVSVKIDVAARNVDADAVIIATSAPEAGEILMSLSPEMLTPLMAIPYASMAVSYMAFNRSDIKRKMDGMGFLIPRNEGFRVLGSMFSSSLFKGRCAKDEVLITSYLGGATDPSCVDLSDDDIRNYTTSALEKVMGIKADPTFVHIKRWQQAMPQYNIGHRDRLEEIDNYLEKLPGVFLTGNYFTGISVNSTIVNAKKCSEQVIEYLIGDARMAT
ncbi:MAG: protoporphyrinogen oxidase [Deltaproteobacteria bacterium]|jgi:protoporphyrinogen/coproporphyrinogen III oxidase|nr:protoporphyrinogen oxidase [Deltaproteobacteria bacterium]